MNWNRICDAASIVCDVVSTIFIGVGLGVVFALIVIVSEIGLIRF